MAGHPLSFAKLDFATTPFLVIWETTQACPLACQHCRAEARPERDPNELSTDEGKRLLDQVAAMGTPVCVLSGGDPQQRPDLLELVRHGSGLGLRMATIPVASEHLTRDHLAALRDAGLAQIAFSLDGSNAELHDNFRKVPGTFARTMTALAWARELGIPTQINTTFAQYNRDDIDAMIALVRNAGIVFWEVFSLIPVGRGTVLPSLTAAEHEALFGKLYALSREVDFIIKVTEAPHYRRFVLQQRALASAAGALTGGSAPAGHPGGHPHAHAALAARMPSCSREGMVMDTGAAGAAGGKVPPVPSPAEHRSMETGGHGASGSAIPAQLSREMSVGDSFGAKARGINAGKGFCFVSHTGEVFPSGFFPTPCGNIRQRSLAEIYRESELMRQLRDPSLLKGRCGICEYADICGGSRARALATTGDYLAEDPACLYQPRK